MYLLDRNCSETQEVCHEEAACTQVSSETCVAERPIGYRCVCNQGYSGNGLDCQGKIINSLSHGPHWSIHRLSLISPHLICPRLKWHHFIWTSVAVTNKNRPIGWWPLFPMSQVSSLDSLWAFCMGCTSFCVLIGCSHDDLGRLRWNELLEIRLGEVRFAIETQQTFLNITWLTWPISVSNVIIFRNIA